MVHKSFSKTAISAAAVVLSLMMLFPNASRASESYPDFDQKYWEKEKDGAKGKIWRGAALGALGVVAIAPTTIFALKAVKNPEKFLALSLVSGIAAVGLTFHGFFSVSFGAEQRDKADKFINQYKSDASSVSNAEEQSYYMSTQKKSTGKMIIFGAALSVQGAIFLTNGIVLSIRKHKGVSKSGIRIWPSYLLGGLLLGGGTALVVARTIRYRQLKELEGNTVWSENAVLIRPYFQADPTTGSLESGLLGQWAF